MIMGDYTIPEAEAMYQKAIINGAWRFMALLAVCTLVYLVVRFVVYSISIDRQNARAHEKQIERIKASKVIGQAGFDAVQPSYLATINKQKKIIEKQRKHIDMLESTLEGFSLGDVRDNIRQQMEQQTN